MLTPEQLDRMETDAILLQKSGKVSDFSSQVAGHALALVWHIRESQAAPNDPITALFAEPTRELAELQEATRAVVAKLRAAGCRDWDWRQAYADSFDCDWYDTNGEKIVDLAIFEGGSDDGLTVHAIVFVQAEDGEWKGTEYFYEPTDQPPPELVAAIKGANNAKSH